MAFSFTPGQIAPQGSQPSTGPVGINASSIVAPVTGPPSNSPFLFIRERGQPLSMMACVQIVLVALASLAIVVSIILFAYSLYLQASIDKKRTELGTREVLFKKYPFEEMRSLSIRLSSLDSLLKGYISPRSPLKFLENVVENKVVIDDFSLSQPISGTGYAIDFTVITDSYATLIQQLGALNLKEFAKVAPKPKQGSLTDSTTFIKLKVTTPILVQGSLPDEIVFLSQEVKISTSTLVTGSITP